VNVEQLELEKLKTELHKALISKLDLEKLSRINSTQAREAVSNMIHEMIVNQRVPLSFEQQARVQDDLLDEVFGL
jgi:pilus assembly protein CpaF